MRLKNSAKYKCRNLLVLIVNSLITVGIKLFFIIIFFYGLILMFSIVKLSYDVVSYSLYNL